MDAITTRFSGLTASRFAVSVYALSFAIPFLISSPQLLTGTIVNGLLILAASRLSGSARIPVIVLPSVGALANGLLFGPQTVFLYYFLPFIWVGNYVLVQLFSSMRHYPYAIRILAAGIGKFLVLRLFAELYIRAQIVPPVFAISMGYVQLMTALLGGVLAFVVMKALTYERNQDTY